MAHPAPLDVADVIHHTSFNAPGTHCCCTTPSGLHVYRLDGPSGTARCVQNRRLGQLSCACLLLSSNYVAYVKSERTCVIFDFKRERSVKQVSESSDILDVLATHSYVVLVMQDAVHVYTWPDFSEVVLVQTAPNPSAACAVCSTEDMDIIAFPALSSGSKGRVGVLRLPKELLRGDDPVGAGEGVIVEGADDSVFGVAVAVPTSVPSRRQHRRDKMLHSATFSVVIPTADEVLKHLTQVDAHKAPIQVMSISPSGAVLASMSNTGTLIRLFDLLSPSIGLLKEMRRGHSKAVVHCIAFSSERPEVACYGDSGTLHVFSTEKLASPSRFFDERAVAKFALSGEKAAMRFAPGKSRRIYVVLASGALKVVDFFPARSVSPVSGSSPKPKGDGGDESKPVAVSVDLLRLLSDSPPVSKPDYRHRGKIPVIMDPPQVFGTPRLTRGKFLIAKDLTVEAVRRKVLARLNVREEESDQVLVLTVGEKKEAVASHLTLAEVDHSFASDDAMLHFQYRLVKKPE